jgi:PHD/YefM family antitoxin component YafN of YafNO toxin-antitoxin module
MRTIVFKSNEEQDIKLLIALANRLGILYQEIEQKNSEIEEFIDSDTSLLYEDLDLNSSPIIMSYEDYEKIDIQLEISEQKTDRELAKTSFGALEDDNEQTLEELLNMLTP